MTSKHSPEPPDTTAEGWPIRDLTDPTVMRALAHPLRLRLIDLLQFRGPLTATECGDALDESPANCSFHLRTLAKYGYVEEAPGGTGRRRPWRAVPQGNRFATGPGAPRQTRPAADELARVHAEQNIARFYDYIEHADDYGPEWSDAALVSDFASYLTPAELDDVGQQLIDVLLPYMERLRDPSKRPSGSRPVAFFLTGVPTEPGRRQPTSDDA